jgi:hypothetical protein
MSRYDDKDGMNDEQIVKRMYRRFIVESDTDEDEQVMEVR